MMVSKTVYPMYLKGEYMKKVFFLVMFLSFSVKASDIWYTPNVTNYTDIIINDKDGQILKNVSVFKLLYENIAHSSDSDLRKLFTYLRNKNIKFALEAPALVWNNNKGYKVEGFAPPGLLKAVLKKIKNNGGDLSYVAMDEPYYFSKLYNKKNKANLSDSDFIEQVSTSIKLVHEYFPYAEIGDIEPFTQIENSGALGKYFSIIDFLGKSKDTHLEFINYDPLWGANWVLTVRKLADLTKKRSMKLGIIFNAKPGINVQSLWLKSVVLNMQSFKNNRLPIDNVIIQSWGGIPIKFFPRVKGESHLGLIDSAEQTFDN